MFLEEDLMLCDCPGLVFPGIAPTPTSFFLHKTFTKLLLPTLGYPTTPIVVTPWCKFSSF